MHRFFINHELDSELLTITNRDQLHQIRDVLNLQPTEQIIVVPSGGVELVCEIVSIDRKAVVLGVLEKRASQTESKRTITLYCSVLKRDHFELVVQKAVEVGVTKIVPLITERTVKLGTNRERILKIILEAAEQSGRTVLPTIDEPTPLKKVLQENVTNEVRFFFDFSDKQFSTTDIGQTKNVGLFIGPEGGWTEAEQILANENGCIVRSLGSTVLRGETAAIVASYIATQQ